MKPASSCPSTVRVPQSTTAALPKSDARWEARARTCERGASAPQAPAGRPQPEAQRAGHGVLCPASGLSAAGTPSLRRVRPVALPPLIPGVASVILHPALARQTHLPLDLRVAAVPTAASNAAQWPRLLLSAPATSPALPSLTIISCDLPWAITVHGSGSIARCVAAVVTVAGVLGAISGALQLPVDADQWCNMTVTQGGKDTLIRHAGVAYHRGMTRLDLFGGKTTFGGLSASDMGSDIWVLEADWA
ncbi:hypothetical protein GGX14DRAFT_637051 [Mycena pura]|uniref:DUF6699 domain-containing protein n=1 Tax=Mycena pura TaxID=153505 RepID=A0AAD6VBX4_9AGAR|nr:hypothetical protein GGX14DRAFT_637051 [Mycena pura]